MRILYDVTCAELEQAVEHVKEMDMVGDSACVPQPRLIHVRDLNLSATMAFFPECTLVHRCPGLGCCQRHDMHCVPSTTTIITRHFLTLVLVQLFKLASRDEYNSVSLVLFCLKTHTILRSELAHAVKLDNVMCHVTGDVRLVA